MTSFYYFTCLPRRKHITIVTIEIGGGNIITATISCAAVEELGLEVGSDAYAVIKATNVMVGIDE